MDNKELIRKFINFDDEDINDVEPSTGFVANTTGHYRFDHTIDDVPYGVYIYAMSGGDKGFITQETLSDNPDVMKGVRVIGLACIHPDRNFVVSPEYAAVSWCPKDYDTPQRMWVKTIPMEKEYGKFIFNGEENTVNIVKRFGNRDDYAAGWCNNYRFADGNKGYLPSIEELRIMLFNFDYWSRDDVYTLARLGGIPFGYMVTNRFNPDDTYESYPNLWSSTQYNMKEAWCHSGMASCSGHLKTQTPILYGYPYYVCRAVAEIR